MQVCEIPHDMCTWNIMSVTWVVHHVGGTSVSVTIVTVYGEQSSNAKPTYGQGSRRIPDVSNVN